VGEELTPLRRLAAGATLLVLGLQPAHALRASQQSAGGPGAFVEEVLGSWAAAGGIQPGDVILSWSRDATPPANPEPANGRIEAIFDLRDVELEQGPRGPVKLGGLRGGQPFEWRVTPGPWGLVVRPMLPPDLLQLHQEAVGLKKSKQISAAANQWRVAAETAQGQGIITIRSAFLARAAGELANAGLWAEADAAFENALSSAPPGDVKRRIRLLTTWGRTFEARGEGDKAIERWAQALDLRRQLSTPSLEAASILNLMGTVHSARGRLEAAEKHLVEARQIRQALAPGSWELAESFTALGTLASRRRDLSRATEFWTQALEIQTRIVPGSLSVALTLNSLGAVAAWQQNLPRAQELFEQAWQIRQRLAPDSRDAAISLMNLGGIARDRGDSASAAQHFERALAVGEKAGLQGLDLANLLQNIGIVAADRGDYGRAEEFSRRALDLRLKQAPESLDTALSLSSLGVIAWSRGDAAASSDYHRQALVIQQKLAPKSADTARTLSNLGMVAWKTRDLSAAGRFFDDALAILETNPVVAEQYGIALMNRGLVPLAANDFTSAETYFRRALQVLEQSRPDGLAVSMVLNNLGDIALRHGALDPSEAFHRRALEIRRTIAPGTVPEAESYHALGVIERRRGSPTTAETFFRRAVDAVEAQDERLGGSQDVQSGFGASFTPYYRDLIEQLIDLGRPADAFATLERSRARALLAMMAQRDLVLGDVEAELARARKTNRAEADRIYAKLSALNAKKDAAEIQTLVGRLRVLRDERHAIVERIRQSAPQFAALQDPQPLDRDAAIAALDPGTVLLSYSVGPERSFLFVLRAAGAGAGTDLQVFRLPVGEAALRTRVNAFRRAIQDVAVPESPRAVGGVASRSGVRQSQVSQPAAQLYGLLIKPAERIVATSERVLIVADGPLHSLPFGALMPGRAAGTAKYLTEWKPLHQVVSATVYHELRRARRERAEGTPARPALVAFGDPAYAPVAGGRAASLRPGLKLAPLPGTRREVNGITALFPGASTVYLGADATEERAKGVTRDARVLHFATHAFVDARFPLNSGLALSVPAGAGEGRDNGFLQVWEILEQMRLDADLVTLSACETALGEEMGGEGLVGLTRAFHYAGARSVLASLWSVADASTSELMNRFYRHLRSGKPKDEALRAAQLDLIRGRDVPAGARFSHPFHWAAFQVFGDWR
jgi:CHAT domain-containing protein/Tfp pilus assembly protein PilF